MGQILHGNAKTTHAIRGELRRSQALVASLAKRFNINEKTGLKWRKRQSVEYMPMEPKQCHSSLLSPMEKDAIVALRVQARLPLDDVYIALKDVIPHLTRSSVHRCLQRHCISALPKVDREKSKKFNDYAIGYFHIDIAELGGRERLPVRRGRPHLESDLRPHLTQGHQAGHSSVPQISDQDRDRQDPYHPE